MKLIVAQKYPNKAFLVPDLGIFAFYKIFQLDKFEGTDFKYELFKTLAQKYPNEAFSVPNLGIFVFLQNFLATQVGGS